MRRIECGLLESLHSRYSSSRTCVQFLKRRGTPEKLAKNTNEIISMDPLLFARPHPTFMCLVRPSQKSLRILRALRTRCFVFAFVKSEPKGAVFSSSSELNLDGGSFHNNSARSEGGKRYFKDTWHVQQQYRAVVILAITPTPTLTMLLACPPAGALILNNALVLSRRFWIPFLSTVWGELAARPSGVKLLEIYYFRSLCHLYFESDEYLDFSTSRGYRGLGVKPWFAGELSLHRQLGELLWR